MSHLPIDTSRDSEPIRLFKSDFLEFFTHISPAAIVGLWLPIVVLLLVYAVLTVNGPGFPVHILLGFILGLFLWTFAEYSLHRFLFHHKPTSPRQERIFFLFHGIHHAQPQVKTRLVMPFPVSIPLALVFVGLFHLVLGVLFKAPQWVAPLTAGFLVGYLAYDLTHYARIIFRCVPVMPNTSSATTCSTTTRTRTRASESVRRSGIGSSGRRASSKINCRRDVARNVSTLVACNVSTIRGETIWMPCKPFLPGTRWRKSNLTRCRKRSSRDYCMPPYRLPTITAYARGAFVVLTGRSRQATG